MRISVQTSDSRMLGTALESDCEGVRFGSEYCDRLLPSPDQLLRTSERCRDKGKRFTFVTPRLPNEGIERMRQMLAALDQGGARTVVVSDFGVLGLVRQHINLSLGLGRQMFRVPSRSPWVDHYVQGGNSSSDRGKWVQALYSSTSLNYQPTVRLYHELGCDSADIDWVPRIGSALGLLAESGVSLSVHLDVIPVTFTRKCHTARFLGEESPEACSRPCLDRAFFLTNEGFHAIGKDLYLHGNAVFRVLETTPEDVAFLAQQGVKELILHLGPVTGLETVSTINDRIARIRTACGFAAADADHSPEGATDTAS